MFDAHYCLDHPEEAAASTQQWSRAMTSDIVEQLRAWAEPISSGYEVPRAAVTLYEAADEIERLTAENAALRKDAERYRFIKQWARRLDITGYSLTNNEHFEPRIDEAMAIASQPSSADVERRPCTCHPDDNPPVPCPRMYALQDCRRAAALAAEIESLRARLAEADALIAKGLAVVHDFLPNIGRCVLQDYQRMNEFCSEAAARTAVSAVQPERCCVDYPRCDCNSPPEPDDEVTK